MARHNMTPEHWIGRTLYETLDDETAKLLAPAYMQALRGEAAYLEFTYGDQQYALRTVPVTDENGEIVAGIALSQNITERKALEGWLVRQERLAALGQLAAGVGHELRNPLGTIANAVYYLQMVLGEESEAVSEYLQIIANEVQGSTAIVSDLLGYTRTHPAKKEPVAAAELIARVLSKHAPPEGVKVSTEIAPGLPLLHVDPLQIEQVLTNLVINAHQAMPPGGRARRQCLARGRPRGPGGGGHRHRHL